MKPKECVLTAFENKKPERVPAIIYGGGVWTMKHTGNTFDGLIGKPKEMAEMVIKVNEEIHSDMVYLGSGYNNVHLQPFGGRIKYRPVGAPDLEEPLVNSAEDLDRLQEKYHDIGATLASDPVVQTIWEAAELVHKAIGNEYLVSATAWGPFSLAAQIYGVEKMMQDMFRKPDLVTRTIEFAADINYYFYEPMIKNGSIEATAIADATASGDLISPRMFKKFALPGLQKFHGKIKELGCGRFLHICGDTTFSLELFPESGAQCIAIDMKVDLAVAHEKIGSKMCIGGNSH
ncbi:MAG: uroporphyrinogen decarboxylase family protein, partial [Eubacteriales bacterium]